MLDNHQKLWNTAAFYDRFLSDVGNTEGISVDAGQHANGGVSYNDKCEHIRWMCGQIQHFLNTSKIDKANRWVGFIQGVFFCHGIFTLEEMKDHNR